MVKNRFLAGMLCGTLTLSGSGTAWAQAFPNKPLRIVTSGVGGGTDVVARMLAGPMTENLGQQVIVDNRGSSVVPAEVTARSQPDGYTMILGASGILWLLSFLDDKLPFDPVKDLDPVTLVASFPTVLVVHPSVPAKSVKELIDHAKARPGTINYLMTAAAGSAHLAAELFKIRAGIDMVAIPYKNAGTGLVDLVGGRVQAWFSAAGPVMPHVKTGKLRALGVTSLKPLASLPDLPAVADTLPGYSYESVYSVLVPARTPAAIVKRLNQEIVRVIERKDIREKLLGSGLVPVGSTPEQLAVVRKSEMANLGKIIRETRARAR